MDETTKDTPVQAQERRGERSRLWVRAGWLLVAPLLAAIIALAFDTMRTSTFESEATLLISFGEEYIARPIAGDDESWSPWSSQVAVNSELSILNSETLRDEVIDALGAERFLPKRRRGAVSEFISATEAKLFALLDPGSERGELDPLVIAREVWRESLNIRGTLDTSVIHISFRHPDVGLAKTVVDDLMARYIAARPSIFSGPGPDYAAGLVAQQREALANATEALAEVEAHIGGDLDAVAARAVERQSALNDQVASLEREIASKSSALSSTEVAGYVATSGVAEGLRGRALLAGLRSEQAKAEEQLAALDGEIRELGSYRGDYLVAKENAEAARRNYQRVLEVKAEADLLSSRAEAGISNVRVIQAASLPALPIGLPATTLVGLATIFGFLAAATLLLLLPAALRFRDEPPLDMREALSKKPNRSED